MHPPPHSNSLPREYTSAQLSQLANRAIEILKSTKTHQRLTQQLDALFEKMPEGSSLTEKYLAARAVLQEALTDEDIHLFQQELL